MSDPQGIGPVTVKLSGTSALLLTRLAHAIGVDASEPTEAGAVLMRALGLLDLALKAKRDGKRLAFIDPRTGETSEVAY